MTFTVFVATFWPLLAIYAATFIAALVLAFALSRLDRRCYVRRLHRMRRN